MRRSRRSPADNNGGLAGWLFADIALVLALVFLGSQIAMAPDDQGESGPTTTPTSTTEPPVATTLTPNRPGVSVNPVVLDNVCVSNPQDSNLVISEVDATLDRIGKQAGLSFGVAIVKAGYDSATASQSLEEKQSTAKQKSRQFASSLEAWPRLTSRYWVKGNEFDGGTPVGCYQITLLEDLSD
jgi:hypothetical protein